MTTEEGNGGRTRLAGTAIRREPCPPEGGRLQDARLDRRGRRRRPGDLAATRPLRRRSRREPQRVADHGGGEGLPGRATLARLEPRNAARGAPELARGRDG